MNGVTYEDLDEYLREHRIRYWSAREIARSGIPPVSLWPNIIPTLRAADHLREAFGPGVCTSGYRSPGYNARVGGAPNSTHVNFNALDVRFMNGSPQDWATYVRSVLGLKLWVSVGEYPTFVHLDTRAIIDGRPAWHN